MKDKQVMPYVGGVPYRCECGCNVFTKIGAYRYSCNACPAIYEGEPKQKVKSLDERIEAWCASPNDVDTGTMLLEASGIIFDLKAERDLLETFKDNIYDAYTPNSHFDPIKLEALLIACMYGEK